MPYAVVAYNDITAQGLHEETATRALRAVRDFESQGFEIGAIMNEFGIKVEVEDLERIAMSEEPRLDNARP